MLLVRLLPNSIAQRISESCQPPTLTFINILLNQQLGSLVSLHELGQACDVGELNGLYEGCPTGNTWRGQKLNQSLWRSLKNVVENAFTIFSTSGYVASTEVRSIMAGDISALFEKQIQD
uniref:Uncharacterized protein n=1 Tax=Fusarium oxysporum (strain Fo5176) TaxID=660025 RepID=A0A0D2XFN4_FUSOF